MFSSTDFKRILGDPAKLGQFLVEAAEIGELEKVARTHAISILLRGDKIPGWILRRRENLFVQPSALEPLARESLPELLDCFGNISERRYRSLCAQCGVAPDPAAIIKAGATIYLSRTGQKPVRKCPAEMESGIRLDRNQYKLSLVEPRKTVS
jgi:hypothetical protein